MAFALVCDLKWCRSGWEATLGVLERHISSTAQLNIKSYLLRCRLR